MHQAYIVVGLLIAMALGTLYYFWEVFRPHWSRVWQVTRWTLAILAVIAVGYWLLTRPWWAGWGGTAFSARATGRPTQTVDYETVGADVRQSVKQVGCFTELPREVTLFYPSKIAPGSKAPIVYTSVSLIGAAHAPVQLQWPQGYREYGNQSLYTIFGGDPSHTGNWIPLAASGATEVPLEAATVLALAGDYRCPVARGPEPHEIRIKVDDPPNVKLIRTILPATPPPGQAVKWGKLPIASVPWTCFVFWTDQQGRPLKRTELMGADKQDLFPVAIKTGDQEHDYPLAAHTPQLPNRLEIRSWEAVKGGELVIGSLKQNVRVFVTLRIGY